jgi:hypothetical protein
MTNLVLDSGRLDIDWLGGYIAPDPIIGNGANGGSGIIEIYYLTPTTITSTGSTGTYYNPNPPYPTIKVLVGGV